MHSCNKAGDECGFAERNLQRANSTPPEIYYTKTLALSEWSAAHRVKPEREKINAAANERACMFWGSIFISAFQPYLAPRH
jgi:hypothetical protein